MHESLSSFKKNEPLPVHELYELIQKTQEKREVIFKEREIETQFIYQAIRCHEMQANLLNKSNAATHDLEIITL